MMSAVTGSFADVKSLGYEEAVDMAIKNSKDIKGLERQEKSVELQKSTIKKGVDTAEDTLDVLQEFSKLYKKEEDGASMTMTQRGKLAAYKAELGEEPPYFDKEEKYNKFYYYIDVLPYNYEKGKVKLQNGKFIAERSISKGVYELYNNYINYSKVKEINETYLSLMEKQYQEAVAKKENGQISDKEFSIVRMNRDIRQRELNKVVNTLNKLKYNLNKLVGFDIDEDVLLTFSDMKVNSILDKPIQEYIDMAIANNLNHKNLLIDLDMVNHELDIMDSYLEDYEQKVRDAKILQDDTNIKIKKSTNAITENTHFAYEDVNYKKGLMELNKIKSAQKKMEYDKMLNFYNTGKIKMSDFMGIQLQYIQQLVGEQQSIVDYNNALFKFDLLVNGGIDY